MDLLLWSGWVAGLVIGLFVLLQLWLTNRPLGCSTSYGNLCGLVSCVSYFHGPEVRAKHNWRLWFLLGLPLGGLVAMLTSPGIELHYTFSMGPLYDAVLPQALWAKGLWLFAGGILMGVGARMAGGCTSGHAISGIALLNVPSIIASICFFIGALVAVQLLFKLVATV